MSEIRISDRAYAHRAGFRHQITETGATGESRKWWAPTGPDEQEARELAELHVEGYRADLPATIADLVAGYLDHLRGQGNVGGTITAARDKLRLLLGPLLDLAIRALTPNRAEARYLELAPTCAAASHRVALRRARAAWKWAVKRGMAKLNPWADVEPVGKPNRGKPQLTDDETKRLIATCLSVAMTDDRALAILVLIFTGVRNSEARKRVVRDVDGGGTRLIVSRAKTAAGNRAPKIPAVIQAAMLVRCQGRDPDAPLLRDTLGKQPHQDWINVALRAFCERARVPSVVPHALRGAFATFAYESDVAADAVAAHLGHASPATTEAHYAKAEAVADARQERRLGVIMGGKK